MLRIVREQDGTLHLQLISEDGVFELEPTAADEQRPDGLYDDDWNPLPEDGQSPAIRK